MDLGDRTFEVLHPNNRAVLVFLPQIAILGVGRARDQLVDRGDGHPAKRTLMGLSLTVDHRAVDVPDPLAVENEVVDHHALAVNVA